jgi:hypothetical protein
MEQQQFKYDEKVLQAILELGFVPSFREIIYYLKRYHNYGISLNKLKHVMNALCHSGALRDTGMTQPKYIINELMYKRKEYDGETIAKAALAAHGYMVGRSRTKYQN